MIVQDNIIAAGVGAIASGLNFIKKGWVKVFNVIITGFFFSLFLSVNLVEWLKDNGIYLVSYAIIYFLVAYFNNIILGRFEVFFRGVKVKFWKQ